MAIDLDDPNTWPDDPAELAKLAAEETAETEPDESTETDDSSEDEGKDEDKEETKEEKTETPEVEEDDAPPAEEADEDDEPLTIDGIPVVTRDGKHVIPHSVLKSEREKRQAAEAELAKYREAKPDTKPEEPKPEASESDATPAEIKAKADAIREEYGDIFADQFLANYELTQRVAAQDKILQEIREHRQREAENAERTEQQRQREAIDNSPALAAWEVDADNSPWWNRAVQLSNMLVNNDDDYAAMSWNDRFSVLPDKLKAIYPDAPIPSAPKSKESVSKKAKEVLDKAAAKDTPTPRSMSEMEASEIDTPKTPQQEIFDMSDAELAAYMEKLATKGEIDKVLKLVDFES